MPQIFVDGHVHIHSCFRPEAVLHCALRNFQAVERESGSERAACFLLLSESAGTDAYAALAAKAAGRQPTLGGLHLRRVAEAGVLECVVDSGARIFVVAGRQIVTAERLEVLALGHEAAVADGQPLRELLAGLAARSCLIVLPWGVGKWLGAKGRLVQTLIGEFRETRAGTLFLGDNANRPFFWPLPTFFDAARTRGIRNLPGSDPLPFPGQEQKVGGFGVRLSGMIDPLRPFASLCTLLRDPEIALHPYGRTERVYPFVRHQIGMWLRKRSTTIATPLA